MKKKIQRASHFFAVFLSAFLLINLFFTGNSINAFAAKEGSFVVKLSNTIAGANVTLNDITEATTMTVTTNISGEAVFENYVDLGNRYTISVSNILGYADYSSTSEISFEQNPYIVDLSGVDNPGVVELTGTVYNEYHNAGISGATVSTYNTNSHTYPSDTYLTSAITDSNGKYTLRVTRCKNYTLYYSNLPERYKTPDANSIGNVDASRGVNDQQLQLKEFEIKTNSDEPGLNGTVTQTMTAKYGESKSINVRANDGYRIKSIYDNTEKVIEYSDDNGPATYNYTISNITDTHDIKVQFTRKKYTVTFNVGENGTISKDDVNIENGGTVTVNENDIYTFRAKANENWHINKIYANSTRIVENSDNSLKDNSYTLNQVKENTAVSVTFEIDKYNINIRKNNDGTVYYNSAVINDNANLKVEHSSNLILRLVNNENCYVKSIKVNNVAQDLDNTEIFNYSETDNNESYFTLPDVKANATINVEFAQAQQIDDINAICTYTTPFIIIPDTKDPKNDGFTTFVYTKGTEVVFRPKNYNQILLNKIWYATENFNWGNSNIIKNKYETEVYSISVKTGQDETFYIGKIRIVIDDHAPVITLSKDTIWTRGVNTATLTGNVKDEYSGVSKLVLSQVELSQQELITGEGIDITNLINAQGNFSITEGPGSYHLYALDSSNNISHTTFTVKSDNYAPTVSKMEFTPKEQSTPASVVNILTGGVFFKAEMKMKVTVSDVEPSSGFGKIELYSEDTLISTDSDGNNTAEFTITKEDFNKKRLYIKVYDAVGNVSDMTSTADLNITDSPYVYIDTELPTVSITPSESAQYTNDAGKWYNKDIEFNIHAADTDTGIRNVEIYINGTKLTEDKNLKSLETKYSTISDENKSLDFCIDTSSYSREGRNEVAVNVIDLGGNVRTENYVYYKDTQSADIQSFEITKENNSSFEQVLNFLTFGNFFNERVCIKVKGKDNSQGCGISTITLYADGKPICIPASRVDDDDSVIFILPEEVMSSNKKYFDKALSATACDNLGNETAVAVNMDTVNSNIQSSNLMIENVLPEIAIVPVDQTYQLGDQFWCQGDIDFNVNVSDADSGIRSVEVFINNTQLYNDKDEKQINKQFNLEKTNAEQFLLNLNQVDTSTNGEYTVKVEVIDNAGNIFSKDYMILSDNSNPFIRSIKFSAVDTEATEEYITPEKKNYGYYFVTDTLVEITAGDGTPSSGIKSITYYTVDGLTNVSSTPITRAVDSDNKISFTIPADFKGQVYAKTVDNVNNEEASYVTPKSIVIESKQMHDKEEHIAFTTPSTEYKDNKKLALYNKDIDVDLALTDSYSGIKKVEWTVNSPNDIDSNYQGSFTFDENKNFVDGSDSNQCQIISSDENLVTSVSKKLHVTNNSNNISVYVTLYDNAGNVTKKSINFSIDKTRPDIQIKYDNNSADAQYGNFFKNNRTATIVITERNFNPADVVSSITSGNIKNPKLSAFKTEINAQNPDLTTNTATIVYSEDGDYTFNISYKDNAKNAANTIEETKFTIDKTLPVVIVTYDNNDGHNGNYYNADRTATIKVYEHNFDPNRVKITGTAKADDALIAFPAASRWTADGDVYTATIRYHADAMYTFDIECSDKASNAAADYEKSEFYIDHVAPELKITGITDKSANNGKVAPEITCSDKNFKLSDFKITLKGNKNGEVQYNGNMTSNAKGATFVYSNFEQTKETDDIYTLTATVTDSAGNVTTRSIVFSVNRFGSTYVFDDSLKAIEGKYIQESSDIVFKEINVDTLNNETIKITVVENGIPLDLAEGTDYSVVKTNDGGDWSVYSYVIKSKLFDKNGKYSVNVYSVDKAGNINENTDANKKAEISFGVDKTAPMIMVNGLKDKMVFGEKLKYITISIKDNLKLSSVKILVSGEPVEYTVDGENYTFELKDSNDKQNIEVIVVDASGNMSSIKINDILVTTNAVVRLVNNTPLFISIICVLIVLIGAVIFVIIKKRSKYYY